MAKRDQSQGPTAKAAENVEDPTVRSMRSVEAYPEGTHPPVPPSEQTWGPNRFSYSDLDASMKPDETTVAQELDTDSMQDDVDKAMQQGATDVAEAAGKTEDTKK